MADIVFGKNTNCKERQFFLINSNMIKNYIKLILLPLPPTELVGDILEKRFTLLRRLKILVTTDIKKNFKLKVFNLIKHTIINFLILIYLPIIFIFYLFRIKFLHINLWQIGSIIHHLDYLVKENKLRNNYKLILFAPKFITINSYIPFIYSKEVKVFKNFFLYFLAFPLIHSKATSLEPWESENLNPKSKCHQIHREYNKKFNTYICNLKEVDDYNYKNFLFKNKIKSKIISIQVRDDGFYGFKSNRSCEIDTYKKTIQSLLDKGFCVVRFVNNQSKKIHFSKKKYYELTTENENEQILQYLIIKNSHFFITTLGGPMSFNFIMNTPFLMTNLIPLSISGVTKEKDRFILKKYYSNKNKVFISLKEIFEKKIYLYPNLCKNFDIAIIDNNEDEILSATNEMLNNIERNDYAANKYQMCFLNELKDKYSICYTDALVCKNFNLYSS
jgi:putative glycosyltransferase (TIGR04372 family)